jgi:hypothetical protein
MIIRLSESAGLIEDRMFFQRSLKMKIGVCGIACEICPRISKGICPNETTGCQPRENKFCKIASCAFQKGVHWCFECPEFPCETTKSGPISFGYCGYIAGKG